MARGWRLTVRHGSEVERLKFDDPAAALDELERRAEQVQSGPSLKPVKMLRDFDPDVQVNARFEISGPRGLLRGREAGLDVMGDGTLVPYVGAILKRKLEGEPYAVLRKALLKESEDPSK